MIAELCLYYYAVRYCRSTSAMPLQPRAKASTTTAASIRGISQCDEFNNNAYKWLTNAVAAAEDGITIHQVLVEQIVLRFCVYVYGDGTRLIIGKRPTIDGYCQWAGPRVFPFIFFWPIVQTDQHPINKISRPIKFAANR